MAKSLQDLLGYTTLTGIIQATTPGLPDVIPPKFFENPKPVVLDQGRYTQVFGNRQTARLSQYGAPGRLRAMAEVDIKDVKLMHSIETLQIDPRTMSALREKDSYNQDIGFEEVKRQVAYFRDYFANLRKAALASMLVNGNIWFDVNGNLLPSSSSAVETLTCNMNANNQNQLNGIIANTWANFSTDIPTHIRNLQQQALKTTGYKIKYAFYGKNVPSYLVNNNYVQDYMSRNPPRNNEYLEDAELPNILGLTWMPLYEFFYEDDSNVKQTIIGDDSIVFTPEVDNRWYDFLEGTYPVPTTINVQTDAVAAMDSCKYVAGMFAYGYTSLAPVGVMMAMGDTMFPAIKLADAIYQAKVANY